VNDFFGPSDVLRLPPYTAYKVFLLTLPYLCHMRFMHGIMAFNYKKTQAFPAVPSFRACPQERH
jgi:hypothetical protein